MNYLNFLHSLTFHSTSALNVGEYAAEYNHFLLGNETIRW